MKSHTRPNPPYTTKSGVQIGLLYQRPAPAMTRDDELIQSALLRTPSSRVRSALTVLFFLVEKSMVIVGVAIILGMLLANTARAL